MDTSTINRVAIPVAIILSVVLALVWPAIRLRRRAGVWPVVLPRTLPMASRLLFGTLGVVFGTFVLWAVAYTAIGPVGLSIWPAPVVVTLAGWAVFGAGLATAVAAQAHMGRSWRIGIDRAPTDLVTSGFFRFVRNPIYTGMVAMTLGVTMAAPSVFTLGGCVTTAAAVAVQARLEERHLLGIHGRTYRAYAARVGRFLPGFGRLTSTMQ